MRGIPSRACVPGAMAGLLVAVLATVGVRVAAAADGPLDAARLPPDGFLGVWGRVAAPAVFTRADLYGRIDGGAEVFLELGFEQLAVQRYRTAPRVTPGGARLTEAEIEVEIYRMGDATAARGIYLARCGKEVRDPGLRERHTVGRHQLMLQRDRYFVVVTNRGGADAAALVRFGRHVAGGIPVDGPVPALSLLPREGLVGGSERLLRGAVGLQAVYTLGEGDLLRLGGTTTAAAADYRDAARGPHTRIVAEYGTTAAALSVLRHVKANLDAYLKTVSATDTWLMFTDHEQKYGVVAVTGRRLEVVVHLAKPPA